VDKPLEEYVKVVTCEKMGSAEKMQADNHIAIIALQTLLRGVRDCLVSMVLDFK
jgi:hypothetical protein